MTLVKKSKRRVIIGFQTVKEALLTHPQKIKELWFKKGSQKEQILKNLFQNSKHNQETINKVSHFSSLKSTSTSFPHFSFKSSEFFDQLGSHHQGIGALMKDSPPKLNWNHIEKEKSQIFLALDQVTDPRNLGALLRVSWLMGVSAVFIPPHRSASLSPSVSKAACGATEHIPLEEISLKKCIQNLKNHQFEILGLSPQGEKLIGNTKLPPRLLWVVGSESKGLRKHLRDLCDKKIKIPQKVSHSSLNVTTAVAIALFETQKQHSF